MDPDGASSGTHPSSLLPHPFDHSPFPHSGGTGKGRRRPMSVARMNSDREEMRRCVLCGKTREQVPKLILGLHGGICSECVDLCNDVIQGDVYPADYNTFADTLPKPKDIY